MADPIRTHYSIRLAEAAAALEQNGFEPYQAESAEEARALVMDRIIPELAPASISFGGANTVARCGIYEAVKALEGPQVLDTWDKDMPPADKLELRRRALLVDLFITGTNAITEDGMLVNLDMIGNRVAALCFGPRNVVVVVGRNKLCADLGSAMDRVKEVAAPINTRRLNKKTPCVQTARCMDCKSPERICNVWTISEKSFPPGRIKVVLVNEELGF